MSTIIKEIHNEIMATDVYISVSSDTKSEQEITEDIDKVISMFKEFESKYSRFLLNSDLNKFNKEAEYKASEEFINILEIAKKYFEITNGIFDPAILEALKKEGYIQSKNLGFLSSSEDVVETNNKAFNFAMVEIDSFNKIVRKPKELQIDLGGIGKGYIVDKVSNWLKTKYSDFCVDAGGDMYLAGEDKESGYEFWAIELEDPFENSDNNIELPTFLLKNRATATSGVNKRKWKINNTEKNHIIDTTTRKSIENELICTTVIGNDTVFSDIMAKVILIMGLDKGLRYCNDNNIAGTFVTKNKEIYFSKEAENYVWKE